MAYSVPIFQLKKILFSFNSCLSHAKHAQKVHQLDELNWKSNWHTLWEGLMYDRFPFIPSEGFNFNKWSLESVDKAVETYQRIVESFKLAYAQRSKLGDSEFINNTQV